MAAFTDVLVEHDKQKELETKQTIARKLLDRATEIAEVADITGLSIEQVQQLQSITPSTPDSH